MADVAYGGLPFLEMIAFFLRKLNVTTEAWTDVYAAEHEWAFAVAGANKEAIVQDFRLAVEKAIKDGTTLEEFRKDFDAIVARYGWDYNGGRDWRTRVIYETNLNTSYAAGAGCNCRPRPFGCMSTATGWRTHGTNTRPGMAWCWRAKTPGGRRTIRPTAGGASAK